MRQLRPTELHACLEQADAPLLLDVREPWEYAIGHIEGSVNLPMGHIPKSIDTLDSTRETVVICHHGMRSLQVAHYLERAGFTRVSNLSGGIDAWSQEVDPNVRRY